MHLPVKLAASLPVGIVMLGALAVGLSQPDGRQVHPVYGFPNAFFIAFLVAIPALLLVVPNVLGAFAANRFGTSAIVFVAVFAGVVLLAIAAEASFLNSFFRTSKFLPLNDWRVWAVVLANILVLLGAAAWYGRGPHA
jgi:hypothetical protein